MFSSRTGRSRFNMLSFPMRHKMRVLVKAPKLCLARRQGPEAILWVRAKNSLFARISLKNLTIFPGFAHYHPGPRRSSASHFIEKPRDFFCHRPRPATVKQGAPPPGFTTLPTRENIRLCEAGDAGFVNTKLGAWHTKGRPS